MEKGSTEEKPKHNSKNIDTKSNFHHNLKANRLYIITAILKMEYFSWSMTFAKCNTEYKLSITPTSKVINN